MLTDFNNIS